MSYSFDYFLKRINSLLSRISGDGGCDLVTGTSIFTSTKGPIYALISNEDDSRILSVGVELSKDDSAATITGESYMSVGRIDTITLTGTSGTATIICNAVSKTATFNTTLTQTATDFVTANAADYLAAGQVLTSSLAVLTFTAVVAGTNFTGSSSGANASGDLAGTAATVTTNVTKAINDNKLITLKNPIRSITLAKGSFWVYYL